MSNGDKRIEQVDNKPRNSLVSLWNAIVPKITLAKMTIFSIALDLLDKKNESAAHEEPTEEKTEPLLWRNSDKSVWAINSIRSNPDSLNNVHIDKSMLEEILALDKQFNSVLKDLHINANRRNKHLVDNFFFDSKSRISPTNSRISQAWCFGGSVSEASQGNMSSFEKKVSSPSISLYSNDSVDSSQSRDVLTLGGEGNSKIKSKNSKSLPDSPKIVSSYADSNSNDPVCSFPDEKISENVTENRKVRNDESLELREDLKKEPKRENSVQNEQEEVFEPKSEEKIMKTPQRSRNMEPQKSLEGKLTKLEPKEEDKKAGNKIQSPITCNFFQKSEYKKKSKKPKSLNKIHQDEYEGLRVFYQSDSCQNTQKPNHHEENCQVSLPSCSTPSRTDKDASSEKKSLPNEEKNEKKCNQSRLSKFWSSIGNSGLQIQIIPPRKRKNCRNGSEKMDESLPRFKVSYLSGSVAAIPEDKRDPHVSQCSSNPQLEPPHNPQNDIPEVQSLCFTCSETNDPYHTRNRYSKINSRQGDFNDHCTCKCTCPVGKFQCSPSNNHDDDPHPPTKSRSSFHKPWLPDMKRSQEYERSYCSFSNPSINASLARKSKQNVQSKLNCYPVGNSPYSRGNFPSCCSCTSHYDDHSCRNSVYSSHIFSRRGKHSNEPKESKERREWEKQCRRCCRRLDKLDKKKQKKLKREEEKRRKEQRRREKQSGGHRREVQRREDQSSVNYDRYSCSSDHPSRRAPQELYPKSSCACQTDFDIPRISQVLREDSCGKSTKSTQNDEGLFQCPDDKTKKCPMCSQMVSLDRRGKYTCSEGQEKNKKSKSCCHSCSTAKKSPKSSHSLPATSPTSGNPSFMSYCKSLPRFQPLFLPPPKHQPPLSQYLRPRPRPFMIPPHHQPLPTAPHLPPFRTGAPYGSGPPQAYLPPFNYPRPPPFLQIQRKTPFRKTTKNLRKSRQKKQPGRYKTCCKTELNYSNRVQPNDPRYFPISLEYLPTNRFDEYPSDFQIGSPDTNNSRKYSSSKSSSESESSSTTSSSSSSSDCSCSSHYSTTTYSVKTPSTSYCFANYRNSNDNLDKFEEPLSSPVSSSSCSTSCSCSSSSTEYSEEEKIDPNEEDLVSYCKTRADKGKAKVEENESSFPNKISDEYRRRVCSSATEIKSEANIPRDFINHYDKRIRFELQKIGMSQLIEASKPATCCKQHMLNQPARDESPYAASLASLPLDRADIRVIKQSVKMANYKNDHVFSAENRTKLNYYTNLVKDDFESKKPKKKQNFEVLYFYFTLDDAEKTEETILKRFNRRSTFRFFQIFSWSLNERSRKNGMKKENEIDTNSEGELQCKSSIKSEIISPDSLENAISSFCFESSDVLPYEMPERKSKVSQNFSCATTRNLISTETTLSTLKLQANDDISSKCVQTQDDFFISENQKKKMKTNCSQTECKQSSICLEKSKLSEEMNNLLSDLDSLNSKFTISASEEFDDNSVLKSISTVILNNDELNSVREEFQYAISDILREMKELAAMADSCKSLKEKGNSMEIISKEKIENSFSAISFRITIKNDPMRIESKNVFELNDTISEIYFEAEQFTKIRKDSLSILGEDNFKDLKIDKLANKSEKNSKSMLSVSRHELLEDAFMKFVNSLKISKVSLCRLDNNYNSRGRIITKLFDQDGNISNGVGVYDEFGRTNPEEICSTRHLAKALYNDEERYNSKGNIFEFVYGSKKNLLSKTYSSEISELSKNKHKIICNSHELPVHQFNRSDGNLLTSFHDFKRNSVRGKFLSNVSQIVPRIADGNETYSSEKITLENNPTVFKIFNRNGAPIEKFYMKNKTVLTAVYDVFGNLLLESNDGNASNLLSRLFDLKGYFIVGRRNKFGRLIDAVYDENGSRIIRIQVPNDEEIGDSDKSNKFYTSQGKILLNFHSANGSSIDTILDVRGDIIGKTVKGKSAKYAERMFDMAGYFIAGRCDVDNNLITEVYDDGNEKILHLYKKDGQVVRKTAQPSKLCTSQGKIIRKFHTKNHKVISKVFDINSGVMSRNAEELAPSLFDLEGNLINSRYDSQSNLLERTYDSNSDVLEKVYTQTSFGMKTERGMNEMKPLIKIVYAELEDQDEHLQNNSKNDAVAKFEAQQKICAVEETEIFNNSSKVIESSRRKTTKKVEGRKLERETANEHNFDETNFATTDDNSTNRRLKIEKQHLQTSNPTNLPKNRACVNHSRSSESRQKNKQRKSKLIKTVLPYYQTENCLEISLNSQSQNNVMESDPPNGKDDQNDRKLITYRMVQETLMECLNLTRNPSSLKNMSCSILQYFTYVVLHRIKDNYHKLSKKHKKHNRDKSIFYFNRKLSHGIVREEEESQTEKNANIANETESNATFFKPQHAFLCNLPNAPPFILKMDKTPRTTENQVEKLCEERDPPIPSSPNENQDSNLEPNKSEALNLGYTKVPENDIFIDNTCPDVEDPEFVKFYEKSLTFIEQEKTFSSIGCYMSSPTICMAGLTGFSNSPFDSNESDAKNNNAPLSTDIFSKTNSNHQYSKIPRMLHPGRCKAHAKMKSVQMTSAPKGGCSATKPCPPSCSGSAGTNLQSVSTGCPSYTMTKSGKGKNANIQTCEASPKTSMGDCIKGIKSDPGCYCSHEPPPPIPCPVRLKEECPCTEDEGVDTKDEEVDDLCYCAPGEEPLLLKKSEVECDCANRNRCAKEVLKEPPEEKPNVFWALTKVSLLKDGSKNFEIIDVSPVPPGYYLMPNVNNLVLVGPQPKPVKATPSKNCACK